MNETVGDSCCSPSGREAVCPSCGYPLLGLADAGRCPECGTAYVRIPEGVETAQRVWEREIPPSWRFWIRPKVQGHFFVGRMLFLCFLEIVALSLVFGAALLFVSWAAGTAIPKAYLRQRVVSVSFVFGEVSVYGVRIDTNAVFGFILRMIAGQLCAAAFVWSCYAAYGYGLKNRSWVFRRLGLYAAGSVPVLLAPLMLLSVIWQPLNIMNPTTSYGRCSLASWPNFVLGNDLDRIKLLVLGPILIYAVVMTVRMISIHRGAMRKARSVLLGACSPDVLDDGVMGQANPSLSASCEEPAR